MATAIDYLRANGVTAKKQGLRVIVSPASKLTPEVRAYVKSNRMALLAELAANDGLERHGSWRVVVDGKGLTMVGEPCTFEEAMAVARWRWPNAEVEYRRTMTL